MTIDALPTKAPFQVFQHTNVITYVGIATHIGRGCEAFNPARHIVVPWLLMIFGQMVWVWVWVIFGGKVNILKLVDGGSAD